MENFQLNDFKKNIAQNSFPPQYIKDCNSYNNILNPIIKGFNCYAYAMQFKIPLEITFPNYQPGFLANAIPKNFYDKAAIITSFIADCECLGLYCLPTTINENISGIEAYKIGIFLKHDDFHFIRQNENLSWSDKISWSGHVGLTSITCIENKGFQLVSIMKLSRRKY